MTLEEMKQLIQDYESGILTKSELESYPANLAINRALDELEEHGKIFTLGSYCGKELPTTKMTIEVTRNGHFFEMKRI